MKSRWISSKGVLFTALLAATSVVLAQNSAPNSTGPAATSTGPLHFASGPPNASATIIAKVRNTPSSISLNRKADPNTQSLPSAAQSLEIIGPLPIYDVNNLAAANSMRTMANSPRWVYFVQADGKPYTVVNMMTNRGGQAVVTGTEFISEEPNASTLKTLAGLNQIRTGSYEVRYLRSNPYGLKAIWLKPTQEGIDYVYVAPYGLYGVAGQRNGILPDKLYTLDDFLKLFTQMIQEKEASPGFPGGFG